MSSVPHLALVGDFSAEVTAHRAIPIALAGTGQAATWEWLPTDAVASTDLHRYDGFWLTPGSPYRSLAGALAVVRFARTGRIPFLGTCGGFQHALLEFARNVAGLEAAGHAELDPDAALPVIAPLACALVQQSGLIRLKPGSRLARAYGREETVEGYQCRYGFNPKFTGPLEADGLEFTGLDDRGEIRACELRGHPFFVGTLFQPERRALNDEPVPVAAAFVAACAAHRLGRLRNTG